MKALKEFDYNLWTTEENGVKKYFVGVKATGEVTEVDAEVMKVLRNEEKKMRRHIEEEGELGAPLSLDSAVGDENNSTWMTDTYNLAEDVQTEIMEVNFIRSLSPLQKAVYRYCVKGYAMDINMDYADGQNPVTLKSEYMLSLCEQAVCDLGPKQKSLIDRCTANLLNGYMRSGFGGKAPTLKDFYEELKAQPEPEAKDIALSLELFTSGSLDTFANETNVDTKNRLICYDIHDLGRALMPIGMLVVLDNILNRITANKARGRKTYIFIDEIYLLFKHEYSANFLFTLWKRVRKYGAFITGITQNVEDLLQSHTARTMLANSELVVMLNQAATDREELASLMGISDLQMGYITNVDAGHGLVKIGGALVPFVNKVPKDTKLYALMTTKFGES